MYVCNCKGFNDKAVREAVKGHPEAKQVKDIYNICSGNEKPNCGKCLLTIKEIRDAARGTPAP